MMNILALCAYLLASSVTPGHAFERTAVDPMRSPVPLAGGLGSGQKLLDVVAKTGTAAGSTFARCGVSAERERDGSVTLEVRTLDGARRGFFNYDQTFSIPSKQYPLAAGYQGIEQNDERHSVITSSYDGTTFEGLEINLEGGAPLTSYEVDVDPTLGRVTRVVISEYAGSTKDKAQETASITCAPPSF